MSEHADVKMHGSYTTACSEVGFSVSNLGKLVIVNVTATRDAMCVRCATGGIVAAVSCQFRSFTKAGLHVTGPGELMLKESKVIGASEGSTQCETVHASGFGVHASGFRQQFDVRFCTPEKDMLSMFQQYACVLSVTSSGMFWL